MAEYRLWLLVEERRLLAFLEGEREKERKLKELWDLEKSLGLTGLFSVSSSLYNVANDSTDCSKDKAWNHMKSSTLRLSKERMYNFSEMWSCVKQTPPRGMAWSLGLEEEEEGEEVKGKGTKAIDRRDKDVNCNEKTVKWNGKDAKTANLGGKTLPQNKEGQQDGKMHYPRYKATCERRVGKSRRRWSIDVYREV